MPQDSDAVMHTIRPLDVPTEYCQISEPLALAAVHVTSMDEVLVAVALTEPGLPGVPARGVSSFGPASPMVEGSCEPSPVKSIRPPTNPAPPSSGMRPPSASAGNPATAHTGSLPSLNGPASRR